VLGCINGVHGRTTSDVGHALSGKGVDLRTGVNRANAVFFEIDVDASALGGVEDIEAFHEYGSSVLQGVEMPAFGESPRGCTSEFGQLRRRCAIAHDIACDRLSFPVTFTPRIYDALPGATIVIPNASAASPR
jgi:hypothetical protein